MTVGDIIEQVRWCVDEEAVNLSNLNAGGADDGDDAYMDNIIKAKINDALRWCMMYAPSDMLVNGSNSSSDTASLLGTKTETLTVADGHSEMTLPADFMRLARVRLTGWTKSVRTLVEEDSDEYVELSEGTAVATADRPVAALIRTLPMKMELWPGVAGDATIVYVKTPSVEVTPSSTDATVVNIPDKLRTAFIYYIAFLLMAAYRESAAGTMLSIAKMNLGIKE